MSPNRKEGLKGKAAAGEVLVVTSSKPWVSSRQVRGAQVEEEGTWPISQYKCWG